LKRGEEEDIMLPVTVMSCNGLNKSTSSLDIIVQLYNYTLEQKVL